MKPLETARSNRNCRGYEMERAGAPKQGRVSWSRRLWRYSSNARESADHLHTTADQASDQPFDRRIARRLQLGDRSLVRQEEPEQGLGVEAVHLPPGVPECRIFQTGRGG